MNVRWAARLPHSREKHGLVRGGGGTSDRILRQLVADIGDLLL